MDRKCFHFLPHVVATKIVKKNDEILMTAKAYNNRVILEWLSHVLGEAKAHLPDERVPIMHLAMKLVKYAASDMCVAL